jgi:hypothetical protein
LDSQFRHFASRFWYCEKTWNRAKTIFRAHSILPPPPKKNIFFLEQEISQEREFVASQIGDYKKMFLIVQTYLGGGNLIIPPHFHLAPQIQCLPGKIRPAKMANFFAFITKNASLDAPNVYGWPKSPSSLDFSHVLTFGLKRDIGAL